MQPEAATHCMGVGLPSSQVFDEDYIANLKRDENEAPQIKAALHVVQPGDTVLELGSGLGLVGSVVAVNATPKRIYAFETNPHMIALARSLYDANGLTHIVTVENRILTCGAQVAESVQVHTDKVFLGSKPQEEKLCVDVETGDFDAFCRFARPDVLLVTLGDGGEADLIRDADLSGFRAAVIELHPELYGAEEMRNLKARLTLRGFEEVDTVSTRSVWVGRRI